jgi:hypothetical protein
VYRRAGSNPERNKRSVFCLHPIVITPVVVNNLEVRHQQGSSIMKKMVWLVGGICAAAVGFLVLGSKRSQDVEALAHRLEDAWNAHNTAL